MNQTQNQLNRRSEDQQFLSELLRLSRLMAEYRTLEPLLSLILDEMTTLIGAEQGFIVFRGSDDYFEVKQSNQQDEKQVRKLDQISESILKHVFDSKKPLLVRNASLDPRFNLASSVIKLQLRSVMCAPLQTKRQILGVIYVENRSASGVFTERELDAFTFFCHHAAVAIENAELNDHLEEAISERTEQLNNAKENAEKANQAKTDFLAYISHELRSPLTSIFNFSKLLFQENYGTLNTKQKRATGYVLSSANHILDLVNDLLDLHKIESASTKLLLKRVDLRQILLEISPMIEGLIANKPISLTVELPKELSPILGDKKSLRQIFINLLSNAAKFTSKGFIKVIVTQNNAFVQVEIEDTGIGIPQKDQEFVFQTYWQSGEKPRGITGSGLGLPIAENLVKLHQGNIWLESVEGSGTTFFVTLPINKLAT